MRRLWLLTFTLLALPALAQQVAFTTDFVSEYVFRGQSFRQGASLQPMVSYDVLDTLTASVWANIRLEQSVALSETDYTLQWHDVVFPRAALSLGGIYYDRNARLLGAETGEVFAGLDLAWPGRPALYAFYDFDANPGLYVSATASHSILLPDYRSTLDLSGEVGFDFGRLDGFQQARATAAVSRRLGAWRLSPALDLHFPVARLDRAANGFRPVFRFSASRSF